MKIPSQLEEIIKLVLQNNDLPTEIALSSDLHLQDDLGLDSIALAELTVRVEDEYEVDLYAEGMVYYVSDIIGKINAR